MTQQINKSATGGDIVSIPIPAELSLDVSRFRRSLRDELRPATALEIILVDEMAHHAASMRLSADAEGRVLRFAAQNAEHLNQLPTDPELQADAMVAASMINPATERVERYGQAHRRGFYRALALLQFLRSQESRVAHDDPASSSFESDEACETYLLGRAQATRLPCPRCGKQNRHYLAARRRWECGTCGTQFGVRYGTVMEKSPLPLPTWFQAILALSREPDIPTADLASRIGLSRFATVPSMAKKIRAAISSPDAEVLLAGLHRLACEPKPGVGPPACNGRRRREDFSPIRLGP